MRPVSMFANGPGGEIEQLEADLHGRWRQAARAVIVLLSARALPPAQIAALLDCHPATVRRWISRFNDEGAAGLADRPRCGRPRLGAAACAGQLDGARRPPAGSHPAEEPAGHRIRRTRGDHRRMGVPAGPPLRRTSSSCWTSCSLRSPAPRWSRRSATTTLSTAPARLPPAYLEGHPRLELRLVFQRAREPSAESGV
jgi:hypothetical protein